jgi:hypothetical protein
MAGKWKMEFKNQGKNLPGGMNDFEEHDPGKGKHFMGKILQRMQRKFKPRRKKKRG